MAGPLERLLSGQMRSEDRQPIIPNVPDAFTAYNLKRWPSMSPEERSATIEGLFRLYQQPPLLQGVWPRKAQPPGTLDEPHGVYNPRWRYGATYGI